MGSHFGQLISCAGHNKRVFPPLLELEGLLELFAGIKFRSVGEEGAEGVIWGCELVRVESDAMGASGRLT